ncbi:hypothetical protein AAG747_13105 [Rapidithrix thailandica]|uniref:Uncharacterized protein n=1 Tax=Rapidithrix thailandica TaxID=413964 RepID=A0AAW9SC03_9BACT
MDQEITQGFGRLKNDIARAIEDLATLSVTTYTGNLTMKADKILKRTKSGNKITGFNTKALIESLSDGANANMDFKLVGFTYLDVDSDAVVFVKENLTPEQQTLMEAHRSMVAASQEARMAFLKFIKELA